MPSVAVSRPITGLAAVLPPSPLRAREETTQPLVAGGEQLLPRCGPAGVVTPCRCGSRRGRGACRRKAPPRGTAAAAAGASASGPAGAPIRQPTHPTAAYRQLTKPEGEQRPQGPAPPPRRSAAAAASPGRPAPGTTARSSPGSCQCPTAVPVPRTRRTAARPASSSRPWAPTVCPAPRRTGGRAARTNDPTGARLLTEAGQPAPGPRPVPPWTVCTQHPRPYWTDP